MGGLDDLRQTFFEECEEQLAELEGGLLELQGGATDADLVHGVFRAVHSIKGGAGAFELEDLVTFAHIFETALDLVRSDRLELSPDLLKVLLRASDVLSDLVTAARDGAAADESVWRAMAAEIEAASSGGGAKPAAPPEAAAPPPPPEPEPEAAEADAGGFAPTPLSIPGLPTSAPVQPPEDDGMPFEPLALDLPDVPAATGAGDRPPPGSSRYEIVFRPHAALYEKANDAVVLLRELDRLGVAFSACDDSETPPFEEMDPQGAYLSWTITLDTEHDKRAIEDVFEFVEDDCDLSIRMIHAAEPVEEAEPPAAGEPPAPAPRPAEAVEAAPSALVAAPVEPVAKPAAPQAAGAQTATAEKAPGAHATIRVDLDRVDRLINLVGELVINQAMLSQAVFETDLSKNASVAGGLDELDQLTREIQESVMAIRAQPLKPLFQRMSRIVREVADATGKQVRLVTEGEWTEVDKTVVEKLADPLTHMIRNAIDHGVETPEERVAAGKSPQGVVKLSAAHRSGRVVIEVSDDGAGVKRDAVRKRAIDRGLIAADQPLSDAEMDNLLFLPGFSTVEKVSNISGRGVGMDVVKKSIHALSGRIFLRSKPGQGSTFTLSLPLTLAVLDGMVVTVAGQTVVAPLSAILETMSLDRDRLHPLGAEGYVIKDRDGFVPIVDTACELGFSPPTRLNVSEDDGRVALLVEGEGGGRSALMVDAIQDQRQVVIKSLETNYGRVPGVAAATILGDGRVALILDVDNLVARAKGDGGVEPMMASAG